MTTQTANHRKKAEPNDAFTAPGSSPCQSCRTSSAEGLRRRVRNAIEIDAGKRLTLVDVGQNTTLGDGDVSQKLVQLLIVSDGELEVTRDDTGLLVVTGGVASQLENLSSEVLEDSSEVDGSAGTDTLSVVALAKETVDTTDRERETGLGRTAEIEVSKLKSKTRVKDASRSSRNGTVMERGVLEMGADSRLRVLGARGLATRLAAASHFEGWIWGVGKKVSGFVWVDEGRRVARAGDA